jgi:hypothetical protein
MGFNRALIQSPGVPTPASPGSGFLANILADVVLADANQTITVAQMQRGAVQYQSFTAGRNLTTPTGAQITAAFSEMNVGDAIAFFVSISSAFAGTWVAGDATVVLAGKTTTPASGLSVVNCLRSADVAGVRQYSWRVL